MSWPAAQALVKARSAAFRTHAVAHLHAPRARGLDDADTAMALNERHRVEAAGSASGRRCRLGRGSALVPGAVVRPGADRTGGR
jgi:hypothetical protein